MKSYAGKIADEIAAETIAKFTHRISAKLCAMRPVLHTDAAVHYRRGIDAAIEAIIEEKEAAEEELLSSEDDL